MTNTNVDSKVVNTQPEPRSYDFSLVHAADLLDEMGDIQNFLLTSAVTSLGVDYSIRLLERQAELLSEVSVLVSVHVRTGS